VLGWAAGPRTIVVGGRSRRCLGSPGVGDRSGTSRYRSLAIATDVRQEPVRALMAESLFDVTVTDQAHTVSRGSSVTLDFCAAVVDLRLGGLSVDAGGWGTSMVTAAPRSCISGRSTSINL